jgi:hypothetical protein
MHDQDVSYPRLIASNNFGWSVYRQATDRVHFDFGQTGLLLNLAEFKALGVILQEACRPEARQNRGLLAGTGSQRAIFGCEQPRTAVLIFDHAVFRFQRADLDLVFDLWKQSADKFELATNQETIEYLAPERLVFSIN